MLDKPVVMKIYFVLFFIFAFTGNVICQQKDILIYNRKDTIKLDEILVTYDKTVDTTGLKIISVLDMEWATTTSKQDKPCGNSNFIVLYDNFSGQYFSLGCAWTSHVIYWVSKNDTLFFYSQEIGKRIKREGLLRKEEIAKYIYDTGGRIDLGLNCDYLIREGYNYYRAYNKSGMVKDFLFRKEQKVKECNFGYYNSTIRKK